jgi:hypothetical protein
MKRVVVSALLFGLVVVPVCAQRGGSRGGGFSGRSAPSFHGGGFRSPGYGGFSSAGRSGFVGAPRFASRGPGFPGARVGAIRPNRGGGFRRGPVAPFGRRSVFGFSPWGLNGWIDPGYLDSPFGDIDPGDGQPYNMQPDDSQQPDYAPPPYAQRQQAPVRAVAAAPLLPEDAVTILFKDGRAPLHIHNYVLTRTTLYVRDQRARDYPLDELDLVATIKTNHDAGVDFQLPVAGR